MAKKIAAKKAPIKKQVKVEKIEPKRGVKKGTKRGAYKKNKIIENDNNNFIDTEIKTESQQNEAPQTSQIDNVPEQLGTNLINEAPQTDISETRLNQFINDYATFNPDEYQEAEAKTETTTETTTEAKEFDFTNSAGQSNGLNDFKQSSKMMVNGALLLAICDFIFPSLIKFIYKRIDSDAVNIDTSKTKLDAGQKESLMEAANFAAAYVFEKVNPMLVFFIGMGAMYSSNFTEELSKVKTTKKAKQAAQMKKPFVKKKPVKKSIKK